MRRQPLKEWTILFYMSIGKGLKEEWARDLKDLQKVGSGKDVNVVVQCREPKTDRPCNRYQFWNGSRQRYNSVPESRANLGDPESLRRFVKWADDLFPSRKTFLIMWGHGYGMHSIFGYDWLDGLMFHELAEVLRVLKEERNKKLDVLGFDACVMQGVEVAYELRDCVSYTVGSPVGCPENAWQYADLLKMVKDNPRSQPKTVAKTVLRCMKKSDKLDEQTILSVLDLGKSDDLVEAMTKLVESLEIAYGSKEVEAARALQKAAWVDCRQLPDLGDVCVKLKEDMAHAKVKHKAQRVQSNARRVRRNARKVARLLEPGGFVVRTKLTDKKLRTQTGVSIFVPKIKVPGKEAADAEINLLEMYKKEYQKLAFDKKTRWANWVYSLPTLKEDFEDPCLWFRQTPSPWFHFTQ